MSDFFEGLAARSIGAASALRPRVASAYETQALEVVAEEVNEPRAIAEPVEPVKPAEPAEPAERAERVIVRDVVLTRDAEPIVIREAQHEQHEPPERRRPAPADAAPSRGAAPVVVVEKPAARDAGRRRSVERIERIERDAPGETGSQPVVPHTIRRAESPSLQVNREPPPEPTIRITIGRVEVRAVQPAPPPPRPAPPPVAPGPTLEEFLAQRDRRR